MNSRFQRIAGRALAGCVDFSRRRAGLVLAAALVLTLAVAPYTATHLGVNADENAMLSNELPHRIFEIQYQELFPALYENIVIVVDAPTPERAGDAAEALAGRMRERPDLFRNVFLPQGRFFEEHALLYLDTEELQDFADRLARVQPYLAALAQDGTLRGLAMMMARGVRAVRDGDVSGEVLVPMLDSFSAALRAWRDGESYHLSWAEVVADRELDARRRLILVQPTLDFSELAPARAAIEAVRGFERDLRLDEQGVRVRSTGDAALAYDEMQLVEGQAATAGIVSFVLVTAILFLALRRARMVLSAVLTLLLGLVWTAGFAAFAIGHLNLISVAFAVLFIGLGVDYGIHFCLRYQELEAQGRSHEQCLRETARGVGTSLMLCAVTTAIGFYAFVPTAYAGVAELGLIAGTGVFISLIESFTVLPALMTFGLRGERPPPARRRQRRGRLPSFPVRHPHLVGGLALLLALGSLALMPRVRFDENPLRVRDPSAESVQALEDLLARGRATPWELNAVAPDMASAEALAARLSELPTVERAITLHDFVPQEQEEKLEILEDVSIFLAPPANPDGVVPKPGLVDQLASLREFREELERWIREGEPAQYMESARRVHRELVAFLEQTAAEPAIAFLEESLLGSLRTQLRNLESALEVGPVTVDKLPPELLERMVSAEGKVRVQILPSEDLSREGALERFVESVREVTPDVQGGAVNIYEASRAIVGALQQAFASAVVVIAILLFLIWRTLGDTAMVLAPLALAALFTGAAAVLFGIPFNFADVIVLPLLLGIGVDSGIHLVHRAQMQEGRETELLETSTARAVVFSAITTIASFGSLAFASHRGMASLGQLLTLGVLLTVVCNLFFLPAFLELRARRRARAREVREGAQA
jgi:hopanoid biosynthesis associated RND transporter like protein HpnN